MGSYVHHLRRYFPLAFSALITFIDCSISKFSAFMTFIGFLRMQIADLQTFIDSFDS